MPRKSNQPTNNNVESFHLRLANVRAALPPLGGMPTPKITILRLRWVAERLATALIDQSEAEAYVALAMLLAIIDDQENHEAAHN